jgi:ribosomal protein S18 acetylase RimI-like enzyme
MNSLRTIPQLEIVTAELEDTVTAAAILTEAAIWRQTQKGFNNWPIPYPPAELEAPARRGFVYLGYIGEAAVSTMTAGDAHTVDRQFWSGTDIDSAFYVHKLAVSLAAQGQGVGERMVDHAASVAVQAGKTALRLDCNYQNTELRSYYEALGFTFQSKQPDGCCSLAALYERPV